ncbi:helix-turn-helix transcriptional regulator [Massilia pseudoviolaceinigra]|uniref:helix-turn-helix transcriptional regulator n=1 Tax=Massilia pseudoviolaceinigra TaxID=3057165 RepID=UPI002796840F|nr:LuxR C-terminal-related transcriptional regulator [Massilia sp. CCM 9206]MDQ1921123.1 LuxR C-terminal-related transcriptional regulator [Massilia sp. CCM 9206]
MPRTSSPSAQTLREHYREQQANTARLRLLHEAGQALAAREAATALDAMLGFALAFSAFDCGSVLADDNGALRVQAARGEVLPAGMRFPAQGALAAGLKDEAGVLVRRNSVSQMLLPAGAMAGIELLFPLRSAGRALGVLQLASRRPLPVPGEADLAALSTLASMLASALPQGAARPAVPAAQSAKLLTPLTPREREVLGLLPHGLTNADIALRLGIAPGTVKVHVERIIHKFGLADRTQVAARAVELGFGHSGATNP